MSQRQRVTEAYVASLDAELTVREHALVADLDRLRLASAKQLERLHFTSGTAQANARQARRVLARLHERRVVTRLDRRIGGVRAGSSGIVYALDTAGQRLAAACGPAGGVRIRRPWTPGFAFVRHQLAVSELYVLLRQAERGGELELLSFDAEPACWRSHSGVGGARVTLKPDAFVRVGLGEYEDAYFIEVDRATVAAPSVGHKLTAYRRYWQTGREQRRWDGVFPAVLVLVPTDARRRVLADLAAGQPTDARPLFQIARYADAAAIFSGRQP